VSDRPAGVETALTTALGRPVRVIRREPLSGGDVSDVGRLHTDAGTFVVKSHASPPAGFFTAEAAGLAALRASGTTLAVPAVVAVREEAPAFLILEDLGSGRPAARFDEAFGRGLAELHRHTAPGFGFACDTFCGTTRQPNAWTTSWREFYRQSRLGMQVELAVRGHRLSTSEACRAIAVLGRLDTIIDEPADGPSLIHGDLWSGNLLATSNGTPALIDPSVAFAHREAEFGMMRLFGGFPERVYAAYEEAFPLEPGWRDRNAIYQLYHLLNHLNLFGAAYRAPVMAVVDRFV
jgi:protein-ribulosamine 3-kinase